MSSPKSFLQLFLAILAVALPSAGQPVVSALQNNYSYALPGTPSYGIAQGSIFVLYGTGVGPVELLSQSFDPALDRNLGGVSIKILVGGVTTEAIPYYVSANQIAAILPSLTPVGDGTVTVTYNGQTSAPAPIKVVESAFGLLTSSGAGNGTAAVQDTGFGYITLTSAANPGQTVIFWGTGLGAFTGADETQLISNPGPLNVPIELYIGGKRADVAYAGRSSFPGLDQINAVIPDGVAGCFVAAYVKIGTYISNFVTIPVAPNGRVCADANGLTASQVQTALSGEAVDAGFLFLGRSVNELPDLDIGGIEIPGATETTDSAAASFFRYSPQSFTSYGGQAYASLGGCVVNTYKADNEFAPPALRSLEAGSITLRAPDGSVKTLQPSETEPRTWSFSANDSIPGQTLFLPPAGGTFTFSAAGGADVGAFEAPLTVAAPLEWINRDGLKDIDRNKSLEVTWTGGGPEGYVSIFGTSTDGADTALITSFHCSAPASAGRFTIPQDVLGSLVPTLATPDLDIPLGSLSVAGYSKPAAFAATGLDIGSLGFFSSTRIGVNYR